MICSNICFLDKLQLEQPRHQRLANKDETSEKVNFFEYFSVECDLEHYNKKF